MTGLRRSHFLRQLYHNLRIIGNSRAKAREIWSLFLENVSEMPKQYQGMIFLCLLINPIGNILHHKQLQVLYEVIQAFSIQTIKQGFVTSLPESKFLCTLLPLELRLR